MHVTGTGVDLEREGETYYIYLNSFVQFISDDFLIESVMIL